MPNKPANGEEEPTFRVTDRRRVTSEGPPPPPEASGGTAEKTHEPGQPPQAETPQADQEEERRVVLLPIADLVRIFIAEFQTRALMHMGLIPNPETRLVAKDLPEARLAIDCVAALIEQLSPLAASGEQAQLRQLLADLRLNFVRESGG